jgi:hypothetical protein
VHRLPTQEVAVASNTASAARRSVSSEEIEGRNALTTAMEQLTSILQSYEPVDETSDADAVRGAVQHLMDLEAVLEEVEHILAGLHAVPDGSDDCQRIIGATSMALVLAERARAEITAQIDCSTS